MLPYLIGVGVSWIHNAVIIAEDLSHGRVGDLVKKI